MQTKKVVSGLILGALLIAGLFFVVRYLDSTNSIAQRGLKPSQLDFTNSNQLQEYVGDAPMAPPEPAELEAANESVAPVLASLTETEQKLWVSVEEILKSRNDSDPRVNDLKNLSSEFKKALFEKYALLKMEDRNGRGFIVFLVSKNLKSAEDLDFLQKVYQEAPCLSLENCSTSSKDDNPHNAGVDQTTTIYPQLVALYQIEKLLQTDSSVLNNPALRSGILATLKQAEAFPVPVIRDRAEKIRQKFKL